LFLQALKDLIKESAAQTEAAGGQINFSPRTTSLSVARAQTGDDAEERFFKRLEEEVLGKNSHQRS
jgi:hypothetical protein